MWLELVVGGKEVAWCGLSRRRAAKTVEGRARDNGAGRGKRVKKGKQAKDTNKGHFTSPLLLGLR